MLQIVNKLKEKGYVKLNPDTNNVYGRAEGGTIYVVVIGSGHNLDADDLKRFNNKIISDISQDTDKDIRLLNILLMPDGVFDDRINHMIEVMDNLWLFTEDYGKFYVFENQIGDFDDLADILDHEIKIEKKKDSNRLLRIFGVVTPILLAINVIIFFLDSILTRKYNFRLNYYLAINPSSVIEGHQYYRLFTAMFVHFGIEHLVSNMIILEALGARVEHLLGKVIYPICYIVTGMVASIGSLAACYLGHPYDYAGGASGALFGLMGLLIVMASFNKGRVGDISLRNLLMLCFLTIANGYVSDGIDNAAHIVGLVFGIVLGLLMTPYYQKVVKKRFL